MGQKVYIKHQSWKKVKQIGARSNKLYKLQFNSPKALISSDSSSGGDMGELWHRRMGHLHHGSLRLLKETMTRVLELCMEHDDLCIWCMLGKFAKATFLRSDNRTTGVLQLIHLDICGSLFTISLGVMHNL